MIPYLGIFPLMFLESSFLTSNLPKSLKMYFFQYWQIFLLILTKSFTGIDKIIYQYCQNCIPVLMISYCGICEILCWYKSYNKETSWLFPNTGIWYISECQRLVQFSGERESHISSLYTPLYTRFDGLWSPWINALPTFKVKDVWTTIFLTGEI